MRKILVFLLFLSSGVAFAATPTPTRKPAQNPGEAPLPAAGDAPQPAVETGAPADTSSLTQSTRPDMSSQPSETKQDMSQIPEKTRPDMSLQPPPQEEWKPSPTPGEPIFDWSKHKNETEVHHPFAEKGLIRISKDDTYYYKTEESTQHAAITFSVGTFPLDQLSNPDSPAKFSSFSSNYPNAQAPAFMIGKEWNLWKGSLGKLGLQIGTGGFVAQGHGHFVSAINQDLVPMENFTFIAFPNYGGVVYRMQFKHRQLFVPYGLGGISAITFTEIRDDNKGPKFGGALAAYAGGGMAINMNYYNYLSRVQLDREYGITGIYLTLEYRQLLALSRFNFTTEYINGGFLFEY